MNKLVCEMCGGTNIIKENGVYICENCGVQYSLEAVRQMLGDSVKIDHSEFVEKSLANARRAMAKEDWEEVEKYYNFVEQHEPDNIEAIFYSAYAKVKMSFVESDIFKRKQKFNVLIKSVSVIDDNYNVYKRAENEIIIRKFSDDIINMYSSVFVYNVRTVEVIVPIKVDDSDVTKDLFLEFERVFVDSLENIMDKDPQIYLCEIIIKHCNSIILHKSSLHRIYHDKKNKAILYIYERKLEDLYEKCPEAKQEYKNLMEEASCQKEKYNKLYEEYEKIKDNIKSLSYFKSMILNLNNQRNVVKEAESNVIKFLINNLGESTEFVSDVSAILFKTIEEIDINALQEYKKLVWETKRYEEQQIKEEKKRRRNPWGIASLSVSSAICVIDLLLSCVSMFGLYACIFWLITALPGIILGIIGLKKKQYNKGAAVAGIIISVASFILMSGVTVFFAILLLTSEA